MKTVRMLWSSSKRPILAILAETSSSIYESVVPIQELIPLRERIRPFDGRFPLDDSCSQSPQADLLKVVLAQCSAGSFSNGLHRRK